MLEISRPVLADHPQEGAVRAAQEPGGKKETIVAMDCEMCETLPDLYELTRLTLLDESGKVGELQHTFLLDLTSSRRPDR